MLSKAVWRASGVLVAALLLSGTTEVAAPIGAAGGSSMPGSPRAMVSGGSHEAAPLALPDPSSVAFACSFEGPPADCGFSEQARELPRATISRIARDGSNAIRLRTEPGDDSVAGSGMLERDDLWLSQAQSDGYQGSEQWWAHSVLFPDDFTAPTWQPYVVFDFHNTTPGPWQANFQLLLEGQSDITKPGLLTFVGYGGARSGDGRFGATLGPLRRNVWYDFVYHVRWSAQSDGFFEAWINGEKKLSHRGPTLYAGQGVYLKLANYHVPVCDPYPACVGQHKASSVIHDRVIRAKTPAAVASGPLEGVLDEFADGVSIAAPDG
jgi:hypothetical protein